MAYIKLSDLPLIESPGDSATVIGVNNGTTGRFAYNHSSEDPTVEWTSKEIIDVTVTITNEPNTNKTFTYDLSSMTLNKDVLYIPRMKFNTADKTTYTDLSYYENKLLMLCNNKKSIGTSGEDTIYASVFIIKLPQVTYPLHLLFRSEYSTNVSSGFEGYSKIVTDAYPTRSLNIFLADNVLSPSTIMNGGTVYPISGSYSKYSDVKYLKITNMETDYSALKTYLVDNELVYGDGLQFMQPLRIESETVTFPLQYNPV